MTEFTLDDVRRIIRACAGVDDGVDLDGDVADTQFTDLGYDSLAVLELAARIQAELQVPIPDDAINHMPTPRATVAYVNSRRAAV